MIFCFYRSLSENPVDDCDVVTIRSGADNHVLLKVTK